MTKPFEIGLADLEVHLGQVHRVLSEAIHPGSPTRLTYDKATDPLVAGLVGAGCEPAMRTRGGLSQVAPMMELGSGLWAWLGYREEWSIRQGGNRPRYSFQAAGLTVHFGFRLQEPKPQMFRAEWAGLVLSGGSFVPQAGNAGHPHWQFDALDSLIAPSETERAREFAEILRQERGQVVGREFVPVRLDNREVEQIVGTKALSAIHFASAAPWWRPQGENRHAHWPERVQQIRDWLSGTLDYLRQELGRL